MPNIHFSYHNSYYILGDFMAIVQTNINYTYESMMANIHNLQYTYTFLQTQNFGFSILGKQIPVIRLRSWS